MMMEPIGRASGAGQGYGTAGRAPGTGISVADPSASAQGGPLAGVPQDFGKVPSVADGKKAGEKAGRFDRNECQTCKNRKYQDGSNDPGVSFKTPTKIDSGAAASAVKSHEMEHVFRERGKAQREGREVVYQNVSIHTGICPECGKVYVSGGTTRTATRKASDEVEEILKNQKGKQSAETPSAQAGE